MNLEEIGIFKERLISRLIKDENIVDVLLNHPSDDVDVEKALLGKDPSGADGCVYKFEYVPDIQEISKTFLCIEVIPVKTEGSTITRMNICVFAYCSKSIMQSYHRAGAAGTRIDILMSDVDKILNKNKELGIGPLEWKYSDIYKPAIPYYGRMSVYTANTFRGERQ